MALHTTGMAKRILEVQGAITGAFASISGAILGVVDKAAMADQSYRLLGLRMMMTTESARAMSMITKTLGADFDTIFYDPELRMRAFGPGGVLEHIQRISASLGPNFEANLRGIRGIHTELAALKNVALPFLGMQFAADLYEKLGGDKLKGGLHGLLVEFEKDIPRIADELSTKAVPVLRSTWQMMREGGEVLKATGTAFTNFVGLLSGDTSIQSAEFSFANLARAIEHVEQGITGMMKAISDAEKTLAHGSSAVAALLSGNPGVALKEAEKAGESINLGSSVLLGAGSIWAGKKAMGILGVIRGLIARAGVAGAAEAAAAGAAETAGAGAAAGGLGALGMMGTAAAIAAGAYGVHWAAGELFPELKKWEQENVFDPASRFFFGEEKKKGSTLTTPKALPGPSIAMEASPTLSAKENFVQSFADFIAKYEAGKDPNALSVRNNNPGNLRSWGDYPQVNGYVRFPDMQTGMDALRQQIEKNIERGLTLYEFFAGKPGVYPGFAPAGDKNDPKRYAEWVGKQLRIDPNMTLIRAIESLRDSIQALQPAPPISVQVQRALPQLVSPKTIVEPEGGPVTIKPTAMAPFMQEFPWPDKFPGWMREFNANAAIIRAASPITAYRDRMPADTMLNRDYSAALARYSRPYTPAAASVTHAKQTIEIASIPIYITQPGADADQIRRAVSSGIREAFDEQIGMDLLRIHA